MNYSSKYLALFLLFQSTSSIAQTDLFKTIYFQTNNSSLGSEQKEILLQVASICNSDSFRYLKIVGFTDTIGSAEYNEMLSKNRADVVYDYLKSVAKFDTTRVYVTWLGESNEVYDLHFLESYPPHAQQRAVDIWVKCQKRK